MKGGWIVLIVLVGLGYGLTLQQHAEEEEGSLPKLPLYVGRGYNIFQGNPLSDRFDPGFKQILFELDFNGSRTTTDGKYLIPGKVSSRLLEACSFSSSVSVFTGTKNYQQQLSTFASAQAGVDFGSSFNAAFSLSAESQRMKKQTTELNNTVTMAMASCQAYGVSLNLFDMSPLTYNFIRGVNISYHRNDWQYFLDQFGTHYTYDVIYGSRVVQETIFSDKSVAKMNSLGVNLEIAAHANFGDKFAKGAAKSKANQNAAQYSKQFKDEQHNIYIGGKPPQDGDLKEWIRNGQKHPMPISYKLIVLSSLFDNIDLPGFDVDVAKKQFLAALDKYCKRMGCKGPVEDRPLAPAAVNEYFRTPEFGGFKGVQFDSLINSTTMDMKKVQISYDKKIYRLQFMLSDGVNTWYSTAAGGTKGDRKDVWMVPDNEKVTQIEIRYDEDYIYSLTFITNRGTKSPQFGGNDGRYQLITFPDHYRMVGISGRADDYLGQLSFTLARAIYPTYSQAAGATPPVSHFMRHTLGQLKN